MRMDLETFAERVPHALLLRGAPLLSEIIVASRFDFDSDIPTQGIFFILTGGDNLSQHPILLGHTFVICQIPGALP